MMAAVRRISRHVRKSSREVWCSIKGCDRHAYDTRDIDAKLESIPERIDRMIRAERQTRNVIEREILGRGRQ